MNILYVICVAFLAISPRCGASQANNEEENEPKVLKFSADFFNEPRRKKKKSVKFKEELIIPEVKKELEVKEEVKAVEEVEKEVVKEEEEEEKKEENEEEEYTPTTVGYRGVRDKETYLAIMSLSASVNRLDFSSKLIAEERERKIEEITRIVEQDVEIKKKQIKEDQKGGGGKFSYGYVEAVSYQDLILQYIKQQKYIEELKREQKVIVKEVVVREEPQSCIIL